MVGRTKEEQNKNSVKVSAHFEYYQPTPRAQPHVRSHSSCMRISSCFILMSEELIKSMWTGLPPGVDGAIESSLGGDDSREELDEKSE